MASMDFLALPGNRALKDTIAGFTAKRSFPHALILSGPAGSGKHEAARYMAQAIACESEGQRPCGRCEICRKIREDISPDVMTIGLSGDRRTIGVEAVREIRRTAYIKPNDLAVKIYLLTEAEAMTPQAQNALLKLFEEPPTGVYFLLLTETVSALLPTVRSRAPELRTELFGNRDLTALLCENSKEAQALYRRDPQAFARLLHAAGGSYGMALALIEQKDKKTSRRYATAEKLLTLLGGTDKGAFLLALSAEATERAAFSELLRLMLTAFRDMTAIKRCETVPELLFFPDEAAASAMAEAYTLTSLLKVSAALSEIAATLSETNVNLRTTAHVAVSRLWELK